MCKRFLTQAKEAPAGKEKKEEEVGPEEMTS
jgi:hypothetical protein